jgi:signal transduction histidine kinase
VAPIAAHKNINLVTKIPDTIEATADWLAIKRLLLNLLGNALKFTPTGGVVEVEICTEDGDLIFKVKDNGIGIPPEDKSRLFQRFWQGGAVRRYAAETGLGLYLCRQIAEGHGGKIWVDSELGHGSIFTVRIPIDGPQRCVDLRLN